MATETETTLRARVRELEAECKTLRLQLDGNIPDATYWLQTKCERQRAVLNYLNQKESTRGFMLRLLESNGRTFTREEYVAARNALPERAQKRILEDPAEAA